MLLSSNLRKRAKKRKLTETLPELTTTIPNSDDTKKIKSSTSTQIDNPSTEKPKTDHKLKKKLKRLLKNDTAKPFRHTLETPLNEECKPKSKLSKNVFEHFQQNFSSSVSKLDKIKKTPKENLTKSKKTNAFNHNDKNNKTIKSKESKDLKRKKSIDKNEDLQIPLIAKVKKANKNVKVKDKTVKKQMFSPPKKLKQKNSIDRNEDLQTPLIAKVKKANKKVKVKDKSGEKENFTRDSPKKLKQKKSIDKNEDLQIPFIAKVKKTNKKVKVKDKTGRKQNFMKDSPKISTEDEKEIHVSVEQPTLKRFVWYPDLVVFKDLPKSVEKKKCAPPEEDYKPENHTSNILSFIKVKKIKSLKKNRQKSKKNLKKESNWKVKCVVDTVVPNDELDENRPSHPQDFGFNKYKLAPGNVSYESADLEDSSSSEDSDSDDEVENITNEVQMPSEDDSDYGDEPYVPDYIYDPNETAQNSKSHDNSSWETVDSTDCGKNFWIYDEESGEFCLRNKPLEETNSSRCSEISKESEQNKNIMSYSNGGSDSDDSSSHSSEFYSSSTENEGSDHYLNIDSDYDSDDDETFELSENEVEDLYVPQGEAKLYQLDEEQISFDSTSSGPQFFEIPIDFKKIPYQQDENDSCPELISIEDDDVMNGNDNASSHDSYDEDEKFSDDSGSGIGQLLKVPKTIVHSKSTSKAINITENSDVSKRNRLSKNDAIENAENREHNEQIPGFEQAQLYNSVLSNHVILLLKGKIFIHGTVTAMLIAGNAESFGYKLKKTETVEIFSPRGYSYSYLQSIPKTSAKNDSLNFSEKILNEFYNEDLAEIRKMFNPKYHSLILLGRNDESKNIEIMKFYMKENIFPRQRTILSTDDFYQSELILHVKIFTDTRNGLEISDEWEKFENIQTNSKFLVIGGKGSGKSTLIRYLVNKNLKFHKEFLFIDLDIGQTELFLPQTVSATLINKPLLGPGYFYNIRPEKSYMFGDVNIILSPTEYVKCVSALLSYCSSQKRFENIPWIINTMGYSTGFGSELIAIFIEKIMPTNVIQIINSKRINNFDSIMSSDLINEIPRILLKRIQTEDAEFSPIGYEINVLRSAVRAKERGEGNGEWDMTPKDKRFALIVSQIGNILGPEDAWIADVKPLYATMEQLHIVVFTESNVTKMELFEAVYGSLVYLCKLSDDGPLECYGLGIVRGINYENERVYVISSLSDDQLVEVNCLAVSSITMPSSMIINQGPKVKGPIPFAFRTENFMATKHVQSGIYRPANFSIGQRKQNDEN